MATLLLTSAGIVPEIRKDFTKLFPRAPSEINAIFITTGAYGEPPETYGGKEPWWLIRDRQTLFDCGIKHVEDLDLRGKTRTQIENFLADKEVIFVSGGNTFYLLKYIHESGFDKVVKKVLNRGALYVGASAGSYVACPSIEMALWKEPKRSRHGISNLSGMNLVAFIVFAHFEERYRNLVDQKSKTTGYPIAALTDKQAILVQDKKIKLLGSPEKNFWNGFKEC